MNVNHTVFLWITEGKQLNIFFKGGFEIRGDSYTHVDGWPGLTFALEVDS
jgi:hypothetical protein